MKTFSVMTRVEVTEEQISDMLANSEGYSHYWANSPRSNRKEVNAAYWYEAPLKGGWFDICPAPECKGDFKTKRVTMSDLISGLNLMAEKFPAHFSNMLRDGGDAETGDVFLQCVVLGDVVYG